jgi:DNA-binding CsgD family transcriptional regulator
MRLAAVPLTAANLSGCTHLWGARSDYTDEEFAHALRRVTWLLSTERARGRLIVEDNGRVRGFGVAAFVAPDFTDAYLADPYPQVGKRILFHDRIRGVVLDEQRVGRQNAGAGLDAIVLNQGFDFGGFASGARQPLLGTSVQSFIDAHQGYKLARIISEAFGEREVELLGGPGASPVRRFSFATKSGERIVSGVWFWDAVTAARLDVFSLPLFTYMPPLICFTSAERKVLRAALTGGTDATIARELGIAVAAVKGRWLRIIERASSSDSELGTTIEALKRDGQRGPQIRHLIVDYVRRHPSELTPYSQRDGAAR